jgi:hypothetical protein
MPAMALAIDWQEIHLENTFARSRACNYMNYMRSLIDFAPYRVRESVKVTQRVENRSIYRWSMLDGRQNPPQTDGRVS